MAKTPAMDFDATFGAELSLDSDLKQKLGLSADEGLRLLNRTDRFLLLERIGAAGSLAIPWDRSLVLSVDVRSFPLADILSLIHDAGKSGFLAFDTGGIRAVSASDSESVEGAALSESHEKAIYFRNGEVVFAASSDPADRLGRSLLLAEKLTLAELRQAESHWSAGDRLGKVLVERGVLSPGELWNGVKHQVEEIVRSLFAYTQGQVYFWEGDVQPDNVVRLALPTQRLVAEGLRRRDEIFRFLALLEDRRSVIHVVPAMASRLTENERTLHQELQATESFTQACHAAGLDPLTGARVVQLLSLVGAVRLERTLSDQATPVNEDDMVRELVGQHVKLLSELVAPLVAVDGAERVAERIRAVVREGEAEFPELFSGLTVGTGGVLDPDELIERSLRLAGDRTAQVGKALGALVVYAEFELMNHPKIADPHQFLEALESLRASIG